MINEVVFTAQWTHDVIITPLFRPTTSQRRFDVIMTVSLRPVSIWLYIYAQTGLNELATKVPPTTVC